MKARLFGTGFGLKVLTYSLTLEHLRRYILPPRCSKWGSSRGSTMQLKPLKWVAQYDLKKLKIRALEISIAGKMSSLYIFNKDIFGSFSVPSDAPVKTKSLKYSSPFDLNLFASIGGIV